MRATPSAGARKRAQYLRQVVSQNVKAKRKALRMTVAEAAERCELHWRHFQKIEDDALNITLVTLASLSVGLDMDVRDLMSERAPEDKKAPPRRAEKAKRKVRKI